MPRRAAPDLAIAIALAIAHAACASSPPPAPPAAPAPHEPEPDAAAEEPPMTTTNAADSPEASRPPSTASYDEALSKPEPIDIDDDHPHLTDVQLTSPMNAALTRCRVPPSAKITIKTAVQNGRAIGVTVEVRLDKPKSKKPPTPAAAKAEKKAITKLTQCVDHNVRAIVWPPSRRRDSFTMEL
jgi:hypothetical protein